METQLHAKIRKKYRAVKAVGPELMDERPHESEFIGSSQSLKTSGEPKRLILAILTITLP